MGGANRDAVYDAVLSFFHLKASLKEESLPCHVCGGACLLYLLYLLYLGQSPNTPARSWKIVSALPSSRETQQNIYTPLYVPGAPHLQLVPLV